MTQIIIQIYESHVPCLVFHVIADTLTPRYLMSYFRHKIMHSGFLLLLLLLLPLILCRLLDNMLIIHAANLTSSC